ncbi:uncharacterized protein PG986_011608 [Apiospora aurea]|uniref:Uncharacterized protein n=1 Tax=Apiospora aurea TaxID=335848 RepID=A0ABR1PXM8_9PEZI
MAGTRLQKPTPVALQPRPRPNTLRKKPPPVSMHSYPSVAKQQQQQQQKPPPVSFDNLGSSPAVPTRRKHGSLSAVKTNEPQYQQYQYYAPYQPTPIPSSLDQRIISSSNSTSQDGRRGQDRGRSVDAVVNTTASTINE